MLVRFFRRAGRHGSTAGRMPAATASGVPGAGVRADVKPGFHFNLLTFQPFNLSSF
jgi:hypothetical protein